MEVDEADRRQRLGRLVEQPVRLGERVVDRLHVRPALEVDHREVRAVERLVDAPAAAGDVVRPVVERPQDAVVLVEVVVDLALVPDVVARRDHVHAAREQRVGRRDASGPCRRRGSRRWRSTKSMPRSSRRPGRIASTASRPGLADDVADHQHAAGAPRARQRGRWRVAEANAAGDVAARPDGSGWFIAFIAAVDVPINAGPATPLSPSQSGGRASEASSREESAMPAAISAFIDASSMLAPGMSRALAVESVASRARAHSNRLVQVRVPDDGAVATRCRASPERPSRTRRPSQAPSVPEVRPHRRCPRDTRYPRRSKKSGMSSAFRGPAGRDVAALDRQQEGELRPDHLGSLELAVPTGSCARRGSPSAGPGAADRSPGPCRQARGTGPSPRTTRTRGR